MTTTTRFLAAFLALSTPAFAPAASPQLLRDINPGPADSEPGRFAGFDGGVLFEAFAPGASPQPWFSDGSETGTYSLGTGGFGPHAWHEAAGAALFDVYPLAAPREIWRSDGSPSGTKRIAIAPSAPMSGSLGVLTSDGQRIWFSLWDAGSASFELWVSDGTSAGTHRVCELPEAPVMARMVGGKLLLWMSDGSTCVQLWTVDGTPPAPRPLASDPTEAPIAYSHLPVILGDRILFVADGRIAGGGLELWASDGTETGTERVADIAPGPAHGQPYYLLAVGGGVLFAATDGSGDRELWLSDGTQAGTRRVADIAPGPSSSNPSYLAVTGGVVYFEAGDASGFRTLWRSDGTEAGTWALGSPAGGPDEAFGIEAGDGQVFFSDRQGRLWQSDGTLAGTGPVAFSRPGGLLCPNSGWWDSLSYSGGRLYFPWNDGVHGCEPWVLDVNALHFRRPRQVMGPIGMHAGGDALAGVGSGQ